MTWAEVATPHLPHRLTFHGAVTKLRCVDCDMTLIPPLRPEDSPTAAPPPFQPLTDPELRPMPHGMKDRVLAEIRARSEQRGRTPTVEET